MSVHKMKTINPYYIPRVEEPAPGTVNANATHAERTKLVALIYTQADCLRMLYNSKGKVDQGILRRLSHTITRLKRTFKLEYEDKERLASRLHEASDDDTTTVHVVEDGAHKGCLYVNGYFDIKTLQQHIVW